MCCIHYCQAPSEASALACLRNPGLGMLTKGTQRGSRYMGEMSYSWAKRAIRAQVLRHGELAGMHVVSHPSLWDALGKLDTSVSGNKDTVTVLWRREPAFL